jgi:WD40 repeat protein
MDFVLLLQRRDASHPLNWVVSEWTSSYGCPLLLETRVNDGPNSLFLVLLPLSCVNTGTPQQQQQVALSTLAAVAAHDKDINALAFSPNDALLATGSQDKTIKLWKLPNLVLHATLRGHKRAIWDMTFSPVDQVRAAADHLMLFGVAFDVHCLRTDWHVGQ